MPQPHPHPRDATATSPANPGTIELGAAGFIATARARTADAARPGAASGQDAVATHNGTGLAPETGFGSRYAVRGEIARGGMGAVMEARDLTIRRDLALKVLPASAAMSSDKVVRFVEEAQIQGQLEHPNICPVHDLGLDGDGRPFFAMKKVKGESLEAILQRVGEDGAAAGGYSLRALLEIFSKICDAVAFAHARGVVHRDLKPANVMIGEFGEVLVMDWGVAKLLTRSSDAVAEPVESDRADQDVLATRPGSVIGTPGFMPPEQALGNVGEVDERSDVYALGGILYAMLTGATPIAGATYEDILQQVLRNDIVAPSRRAPDRVIPPDFEAATMKALSATKDERYRSVLDLRDEVTAFLEGRALKAADYHFTELARKWVVRHRLLVMGIAAAFATAVVSAGVYLAQQTRARRQMAAALHQSELNLAEAMVAQGTALDLAGRSREARARYTEAKEVFRRVGVDSPAPELGLLATYQHAPPPLLTISELDQPIESLALSPDGGLAVSGGKNGLVAWDTRTGRRQPAFQESGPPVHAVALSKDGRWLLAGAQGSVGLWELGSGKLVRRFSGHEGSVKTVALSRDGQIAASGGIDKTVHVWEVASGRELRRFVRTDPVAAVALSDDGHTVITLSGYSLHIVDVRSGRELHSSRHSASVEAGVLTGRAHLAISGMSDGSLKFVEVASGKDRLVSFAHRGGLLAAAASADGRVALTGGRDGLLKVWDLSRRTPMFTIEAHRGAVMALAVSANGQIGVSSGSDGRLHVWKLAPDSTTGVLRELRSGLFAGALSPDGRLALTGDGFARATLRDVATGKVLRVAEKPGWIGATAFSSDGRFAVFGGGGSNIAGDGGDNDLRLWDLGTGAVLRSFVTNVPTRKLALTPDGRLLLAPAAGNTARIWETATGRETAALRHDAGVSAVAVSPDGKLAASGTTAGGLALWQVGSGQPIRAWPGHTAAVTDLAFSPDGRTLLSASRDTLIRSWTLDGAEVQTLRGHAGHIWGLAPFANGRLLASTGWDGTLRIWDLAKGRELQSFDTPGGHRSYAVGVSQEGGLALVVTKGPLGGAIGLYDFGLPARYRAFDAKLANAASALARPDQAPGALASFGQWYALRGVWPWAAEFLAQARQAGQPVSPLELGRVHWQNRDFAAATREFKAALLEQAAPPWYLQLCLNAIERERGDAGGPLPQRGPPGSRIEELVVMDPEAGDWTIEADLQNGLRAFHGSSYPHVVDNLDPRLRGADWLRPAAYSKSFHGDLLARMRLRKTGDVYVAASDSTLMPAFLEAGWTETELSFAVRNLDASQSYRVFKKHFAAGPVELGPLDFLDGHMYLVAVK